MINAASPSRLPNFIIAGAPRCATTWLAQTLNLHPYISMAQPIKPEPKFFLIDELFERGVGYYSETWFADLPQDNVLGEKSTNYLESPIAAKRIKDVIPDVKLIFILRNPVSRAFSNYLWSKVNGIETESFSKALELEKMREKSLPKNLQYARPFAYRARGLYAQMLESYYNYFSANQILILRYEDVQDDPELVMRNTHDFLGIPDRPVDATKLGIVNPVRSLEKISDKIAEELTDYFLNPNQDLARLTGWDLWPSS